MTDFQNSGEKEFITGEERFFSAIPGIESASAVATLNAENLSEEEFTKNWVNKNKACLIKGALTHWPAIKNWKDKSYWLSQFENFQVRVVPHENFGTEDLMKIEMQDMNFHDAIERLFSKRDPILSLPFNEIRPGNNLAILEKDILGFRFLNRNMRPRMYPHLRLFIYRRASTTWHYHPIDETLLCQVNGKKKVALLSPSIPSTKEVDNFLNKERYLKGDKLEPSLKLNPLIAEVAEGDALYIPPYWYHAVVPADSEVGFTLSYCWKSPWHLLGNFSNYFVREFYSQLMRISIRHKLVAPFWASYALINYAFARILRKA